MGDPVTSSLSGVSIAEIERLAAELSALLDVVPGEVVVPLDSGLQLRFTSDFWWRRAAGRRLFQLRSEIRRRRHRECKCLSEARRALLRLLESVAEQAVTG